MLPIKGVYNSYYFIFPHIYYYCEEEKKVSFHLLSSEINSCKWPDAGKGLENTMNKNIKKSSKKFTKRITKWERKHPVATTALIIADGAATATGIVMSGIYAWRNRGVLKNLRNNQPQPQVPPTETTATSES